MTDKNLTEIVAIIDRSGSMQNLSSDTIGGFNSFIESQKNTEGRALITRVQFDDEYQIDYQGVDVNEAPLLDESSYTPRGTTALFDAVGRTVNTIGQRLAATPEHERPGQVIFVIITDGLENASKEFGSRADGGSKLRDMVNHQIEKYSWQFIYLGGGDLESQKKQGASLGIRTSNVYGYSNNSGGTKALYTNVGAALSRRRMGAAAGAVYSADASVLNKQEAESLIVDDNKAPSVKLTSE